MNELDLIRAVQNGDSRAFGPLLSGHLVMVGYHARRWAALLSFEDLYQAACVAVWRAALTFDPTAGASFATHARRRVRADLRRCARQWAKDVADAPAQYRAEHYDASDLWTDDDGSGIDAYVAASGTQEAATAHDEAARHLRQAITGLPERHAAVIVARWFTEDEPLSMTETAAAVGLRSKEHTQQVHQVAMLALARNQVLQTIARAEGWPLGRKPVDPRDVHAKPKKTRREPGAEEIAAMREKTARGMPAAAVGAEHGISYQRVRALVEKAAA